MQIVQKALETQYLQTISQLNDYLSIRYFFLNRLRHYRFVLRHETQLHVMNSKLVI